MNEQASNLCPSSVGAKGAWLLGLVQGDNTVALLQNPLEIDQAFIDTAKESGPLEKRFRFANKCVKSGCRQWTGSRCGVIDVLVEANPNLETYNTLKPCAIRNQCRWYSQ